jgi:hypothetical protein
MLIFSNFPSIVTKRVGFVASKNGKMLGRLKNEEAGREAGFTHSPIHFYP